MLPWGRIESVSWGVIVSPCWAPPLKLHLEYCVLFWAPVLKKRWRANPASSKDGYEGLWRVWCLNPIRNGYRIWVCLTHKRNDLCEGQIAVYKYLKTCHMQVVLNLQLVAQRSKSQWIRQKIQPIPKFCQLSSPIWSHGHISGAWQPALQACECNLYHFRQKTKVYFQFLAKMPHGEWWVHLMPTTLVDNCYKGCKTVLDTVCPAA